MGRNWHARELLTLWVRDIEAEELRVQVYCCELLIQVYLGGFGGGEVFLHDTINLLQVEEVLLLGGMATLRPLLGG